MSFKIIAITNRHLCAEPLPQRVAALCNGAALPQVAQIVPPQIDQIIVREKDLPEYEYRKLLGDICDAVPSEQHDLIAAHTFAESAKVCGLTTLHVPFEQLKANPALVEEFPTIGVSVHHAEEAREAEKLGASYLVAGHIFPTTCKAGVEARGIDFLHDVVNAVGIPVYAIGGINAGNVDSIKEAGAAGACLMSAYMA